VKIFYTLNGIIRHENKYFNKEPLFNVIKNRITENVIVYFSDRIFYLSEFSKSILYRYYSPDSAKLSKAINGLDNCFLEIENNGHSLRENNSVVFIGNTDHNEKGFDFLYSAIKNCNVKIKLYVIDSSDKLDRVKECTNVEVIIFDKMTPVNMVEFLRDKRIIVTPSEYDTFSISTLEAVSCGLYPVLTGQTGISEIIGKYANVSVINYGDSTKFADVLSNLISSETSYDINADLKEFSWSNVFQNFYLNYYKKNSEN
jgi:glycosyltransferase involved in cell wall biosynthesis